MAHGGGEGLQFNISYDLNGRDPKEIEKVVKATLEELALNGTIDPDAYKILPQEIAEDWELELMTGNEGCSCPIVLQLCGVKGDSKPIVLFKDMSGKTGFQPGQTSKFLITIGSTIGDVFKLRFGFPENITEAAWSLKSVKMFHPIDKDTFKDNSVNMTMKKSIALDPWQEVPVIWPDYPKLPVVKYQIYVFTSLKSGRMDSGVYVILYGDYGNSGKRLLKKSLNSKVKFQPCQNDRFEISAVKLGEVRKIWVQNDCTGTYKSWQLEKLVVKESADSEREWLFKCRRFFDPNKGDRKTDRILELGKEPDPEPDDDDHARPPPPPKPAPKPLTPSPPPSPEPPPPPPVAKPKKKANQDDWGMWWENRKEQIPCPEVDVVFTMIGQKSESEEIELSRVPIEPGEMKKKFKFQVDPDVIGPLSKVRIRLGDEVKHKTRWELAKLSLKHMQTGALHIYQFQKPIIKKKMDTTTESSETKPTFTYICSLATGNRPGLVGNENVYLVLRGETSDTGTRPIPALPEDKRGEVMKVEIDAVDLGPVTGIRLGHDIPGKGPAHFFEKITIQPSHVKDLQYIFSFEEAGKPPPPPPPPPPQYDANDWELSWVNEDTQPLDTLQVAAILFGEKGQSTSYFIDVELKPGESTIYKIRVDKDIGELIKVRMCNAPGIKGKHPWLICEMRLKNLLTGKYYTFQLGNASGLRKYRVELHYAPRAFTTLSTIRFNIQIVGDKKTTEKIQLENKASKEADEKAAKEKPEAKASNKAENEPPQPEVETFDLELPDLGEINNLRLGHNKKNKQIGFFVTKVAVKPQHLPNKEWVFNIPYKEEPKEEEAKVSQWLISWTCSEAQQKVLTTVIFVLYSEDGKKTPEISAQTMLRPGQSEEVVYEMENPKEFKLYKVRVGFWDKQYDPIQWNLKLVRIRCVKTKNIYTFTLNGLVLFNEERDGWREIAIDVPPDQRRPASISYEVQVFTSKEVAVVIDSKLHILIKGKIGDTGKRKLLRSLNNGFKNFMPGRMDMFRLEAVDLDEIQSITVGHNDQGRYPSWHCERIVITDRHAGQVYEFDMNKWFDKLRSDRKIERDFPVSRINRAGLGRKWFIRLKTGDHPRCSTKTPLGIFLCGTENTSDIVLLGKNMGIDGYKPKEVYECNADVDLDDIEDVIGELVKVRLGFLDWNQWPCLLISEVFLEELVSGAQYYVDVNEWVWASPTHDGWREFQVKGPAQNLKICKYQLAVWTGPEQQANTNASIFCQVYGTKGDTGKRRLCSSKTHSRPFQLGQMDTFDIEAVELGDIKKVAISMIAEEAKDNWHMMRMVLQLHPFGGEEFVFDCNRWFDNIQHTQMFTPNARNEGRPYNPQGGEHLIFLTTGVQRDSPATSALISLRIFGEKGIAGPFPLERPPILGADGLPIPVNPRDRPFQPGGMDYFPFMVFEEQIGRILKVRLTSDNRGRSPRWFLEKCCIQNLARPRIDTLHFNCNDWLSDDRGDGELSKEFATEHPAETPLQSIRYKVEIGIGLRTSPQIPPDVDCTITLYGASKFNSGPRRLRKNADSYRLLQAGVTNTFFITAVGVGDINRVVIGHTCIDARFKFHVRDITVSWDPNNKITFPCDEVAVKTKPNVPAEITLAVK